eukprot:jgi/Ulvmu1/12083/UM084_0006.1
MAIMKTLALLAALLASACLAMADSPSVPSRPENCGSNCCRRGFRCCTSPSGGSRFQSRFALIRCIRSSGCCGNPNNACAPQPPPLALKPPAPELSVPGVEPSRPEPSGPEPSLPEPSPSQPELSPSLPELSPSLPSPSLPSPSLPSPSLPSPSLPSPSLPEPSPTRPAPSLPEDVPSKWCEADCCPPGLDCVCGRCQVFLGSPVMCAADSGTCCGNPENPCATDV